MNTEVRHYRLLPEALPTAQERAVRRAVVPQIAIVATVMVLSLFLAMRSNLNREVPITLAVFIGLFLAYLAFVPIRRARSRLARCWQSYLLEIGPDYLLRQQGDTPDIHLAFSEVKRIEHRPGRYLRIVGTKKYHVIGIPEGIENFPEILQSLSGLAPITSSASDLRTRGTVITALAFAAWMAMLWSESPRIIVPLAVLVAGFMIWLFAFIQRSPNTSRGTKRMSWLYLLLLPMVGLKLLGAVGSLIRR